MSVRGWCPGLALLVLLAGCGGTKEPASARDGPTQQEVTRRLAPLIASTARAMVPSPRLVGDGFGGRIIVPCQDEGPVRTVHVMQTLVIANTARDSASSYLAPARSILAARGFRLEYADRYELTMERDGYVVQVASSPSGRPSITGDTPCVRPADPEHPLGL